MIADISNFVKIEFGVGYVAEDVDVRLSAYAILPDGGKVIAVSSRSGAQTGEQAKEQLGLLLDRIVVQLREEIVL